MKKIVSIVGFIMCCAFAKACTTTSEITNADAVRIEDFQKFISHQVKEGETLYGIAKKYGITAKEITKLNPDAKEGVYEGLVLILPVAPITEERAEQEVGFKTHKVKRKETLYSISKKYEVPQEVIKKYNKDLYSRILRKGDKIRIPTNYKAAIVIESDTKLINNTTSKEYKVHKVIAKETKYGIARKYGITIGELEKLNQQLDSVLKIGDALRVPKATFAKSAIIDTDKYAFYEVQKGNTLYSLLKRFNMEAEALSRLNPALDEGLKEGMILKVPKGSSGTYTTPSNNEGVIVEDATVDIAPTAKGTLLDKLSNFTQKRIAIMLPFGVNRVNSSDTVVNEDLLKNDRILRLSLDLYSGMLMATEDAKKLGIPVEVDTYDTEYINSKNETATNARKIENIVTNNDFSNIDAVIGPLLGSNLNRASSLLRAMKVPVLSPLSSNVKGGSNVFISKPTDQMQAQLMLDFLKENGEGKNIVIIADAKNTKIASSIKTLFPNAKTVTPRTTDKGYFLNPDDIPSQLSDELDNWVFIETNDVPLISHVTTNLNAQLITRKVTLLTTNRGRAYDNDEIQHTTLRNLNFHFPSIGKEVRYEKEKSFIDSYLSMYGVSPSEEAIRGYDLMYDTLLRLAYAKDLYAAAASGIETDYIENKFRYINRNNGGYSNEAVYLLKYTENLELEEVEVPIVED